MCNWYVCTHTYTHTHTPTHTHTHIHTHLTQRHAVTASKKVLLMSFEAQDDSGDEHVLAEYEQ